MRNRVLSIGVAILALSSLPSCTTDSADETNDVSDVGLLEPSSEQAGEPSFGVHASDMEVPDTLMGTQPAQALTRPAFRMPFLCGQTWRGNNWNGHNPAHSIDWNHYDANGNADDYGRRVVASAGGTVLESYYSTSSGYGHVIVIGHGDGWRTRYAHLSERLVAQGATVTRGQVIGKVGNSSATSSFPPHLHYEQIHNGGVVVSVIQGFTWSDFTNRYQTSTNGC